MSPSWFPWHVAQLFLMNGWMDRQMDLWMDGWGSVCEAVNPTGLLPCWAFEAQKDGGRRGGLMLAICLPVWMAALTAVCVFSPPNPRAGDRCSLRRRLS